MGLSARGKRKSAQPNGVLSEVQQAQSSFVCWGMFLYLMGTGSSSTPLSRSGLLFCGCKSGLQTFFFLEVQSRGKLFYSFTRSCINSTPPLLPCSPPLFFPFMLHFFPPFAFQSRHVFHTLASTYAQHSCWKRPSFSTLVK